MKNLLYFGGILLACIISVHPSTASGFIEFCLLYGAGIAVGFGAHAKGFWQKK